VEATLRNLPAPAPFVMRWDYPLMRIASDLDPRKLKSKAGRPSKYYVDLLPMCLTEKGLTAEQWKASVQSAWHMSDTTYYELRKQALATGLVEQREDKFFAVPQAVAGNFKTPGELAPALATKIAA